MNILQINNYFYIKGGSEKYFFEVSQLLKRHNHEVIFFSVHDNNNNIDAGSNVYFGKEMSFDINQSFFERIETALRMLYSFENNKIMRNLLIHYKIDIAHAHNIYHRVNPSVLVELTKKEIPVVMTLHDYKICCPIYTFYRNGNICTECIKNSRLRIIKHKCTKGSLMLSLFHYIESTFHNLIGLYKKNINMFICPSKFSLRKHAEGGIPEDKLVHIPNFINVSEFNPNYESGDYILYVGRLSKEKGIFTLLKAVKGIDVRLKIVGDGPIRKDCEEFVSENSIKNVEFLGYKTGNELKEIIRNCNFLIIPSEWYENAPMTIIEAFAYGKPMIGANIGGIPEMIIAGETGLLFQAGDYNELREKIIYLLNNPSLITKMGKMAREKAESEYSEEIHYQRLIEVYKKVLE
jgi:glycosyltransferase involved in cell wall biosynthesis